MIHYLVNRLGQSLVLLALVSVIGFAVLHLAPGGPLSQFALVPGEEPQAKAPRSLRKSKPAKPEHLSPTRRGKPGKTKSKARARDKKSKGKRR